MRYRTAVTALLLLAVSSAPSLASFSGGPKDDPKPASSPESSAETTPGSTSRQEAQTWYGDAYDDVAKGDQDLANGKAKNAAKRFKRAMERGERAVGLDSTYHEAYNLIGYCARNLELYPQSLAAYQRCLAIRPDYAPAREYLGELYVETGEIDKANEQLAWLETHDAADAAKSLRTKLGPKAGAGVGMRVTSAPVDTLSTQTPEKR